MKYFSLYLMLLGSVFSTYAQTNKQSQYQLLMATCTQVDSSGTFISNDSIHYYYYDATLGNITGSLSTVYDATAKKYVPDTRDSFFYNMAGLDTDHITQVYNSGKPFNLRRELSYFDANGIDTLIYLFTWNSTKKTWEYSEKERHIYRTGREDQFIIENWNKSQWQPYSRSSYSYNTGGKRTGTVYESWNGKSYDTTQSTTYTYDGSSQLTGELVQDVSGGSFTNNSRILYTYSSGNLADELSQYWDGSAWQRNTRTIRNYNSTGTISDQTIFTYDFSTHKVSSAEHCVYSYKLFTAIREDIASIGFGIKIYPNPAIGELNISSEKPLISYEAYSTTGALMSRALINSLNSSINTSTWAPGIYLLQLRSTEGRKSLKVVVGN
jgi:hypothetical protein